MGDIKMNVNEPKITAASYTPKGGTSQVSLSVQMFCYSRLTTIALQICIYYIDNNNQLHKMCWSSNGMNEGWYRGSLGTALIKVAPKSLLAVMPTINGSRPTIKERDSRLPVRNLRSYASDLLSYFD